MRRPFALAMALLASPLCAQHVIQDNQVRLLVPRPPRVAGIQKLVVIPGNEPISHKTAQALQQELTRHGVIQPILLPREHPLTQRTSAEGLTPQDREALRVETGADHALWLQLGRYKHKAGENVEHIAHAGTIITMYKQTTIASGWLEHSILPLGPDAVTHLPAHQIAKDWVREGTNMRPMSVSQQECMDGLSLHAARRVIQSVIEVQEVKPVPYFEGGDFKASFALLKAGNLDGALANLQALQQTSQDASPKQQARLQYNLGVLHALKGQTREAVTILEKALTLGKEEDVLQKTLAICKAAVR